jgi:hypothetical protein
MRDNYNPFLNGKEDQFVLFNDNGSPIDSVTERNEHPPIWSENE